MIARTLPGRLSTERLNVSGGMAAHSSWRAVARAVSDVRQSAFLRVFIPQVFYGIQDRTLGGTVHFWTIIVHKPVPHRPCFMAGSIVMLIQTIVITELVF
jgi:hypothetical protein